MAISSLEDQLGTQLFLRHPTQGLILTPGGRELLVEARNLLEHANEFAQRAQSVEHGLRGSLNVGCFMTIAPVFMPELVRCFVEQHPQTELKLFEGGQDWLLKKLEKGDFVVAFLYDYGLPLDIYYEPLRILYPYILLPADHHLAQRTSIDLTEIGDEPFILFDVAPSRDYFLAALTHAGVKPNVRFRSPSFEVVRGLVGQGFGYSILVTRPRGDMTYDGRNVSCVRIKGNQEPSRIVIARLPMTRPTRLMNAFWNFSKAFFSTPSLNDPLMKGGGDMRSNSIA
jgi:DNA-binding transcriptional LysR family regulator